MSGAQRLLVTGGAGFIGCNFVRHWLDEYPNATVVVLDALTYAGRRGNLADVERKPGYSFAQGNICDQSLVESLLEQHQLDTIVHLAAESHVDRSIVGPDIFIETNVVGTHSLLKAARDVWKKSNFDGCRFHHVSTDEVFGALGPDDPPFTEESPYAPNSPYAASKAASDHLVRAYRKTYGLPVSMSNCSNNFGPYQNTEKLIPLVIKNALLGQPIPLYGDGSQRRDWLCVDEHCRALAAIVDSEETGSSYNIGGNCEMTNLSMVKTICEELDGLLSSSAEWRATFANSPAAAGGHCIDLLSHVDDRPGHDFRYAICGGKIERELGFAPSVDLRAGINKTIGWMLAHADRWNAPT